MCFRFQSCALSSEQASRLSSCSLFILILFMISYFEDLHESLSTGFEPTPSEQNKRRPAHGSGQKPANEILSPAPFKSAMNYLRSICCARAGDSDTHSYEPVKTKNAPATMAPTNITSTLMRRILIVSIFLATVLGAVAFYMFKYQPRLSLRVLKRAGLRPMPFPSGTCHTLRVRFDSTRI
jgi:hypothetical protein